MIPFYILRVDLWSFHGLKSTFDRKGRKIAFWNGNSMVSQSRVVQHQRGPKKKPKARPRSGVPLKSMQMEVMRMVLANSNSATVRNVPYYYISNNYN